MFCVSEAATAICRSSEQHHSATIHLGSGRAIDRHSSRRSTSPKNPAIAQSHHPHKQEHNLRRRSFSSSTGDQRKLISSASLVDAVRNSSCIRPSAYFTPSDASSRCLLSENQFPEEEKQPRFEKALVTPETTKNGDVTVASPTESVKLKKIDVVPPQSQDKYFLPFRIRSDQVVVVRVSLHCKGCAGKVKRHISRMQGVTSFNIDFDGKKVMVVGDVTPSEVLASISKVRTAQLLPPEKPNAPPALKQTN